MSLLETLRRWLATVSPSLRRRSRIDIPAEVQRLEPRALLSSMPSQFVDPHPNAGNQFGTGVTVLANGNVVITSPNDDAGGGNTAAETGAGAVYLFNGKTGALISKLTGSHAGDQIGSGGVTALTNSNFVIDSPDWNGNRGAVTFGSETNGMSGAVSASNSLVGSTANDQIGDNGITALSNGNYVVDSPQWSNGHAADAGAVTWGSGKTGVKGTISTANSLVGTKTNDVVGIGDQSGDHGVVAVSNGNYVVDSSAWDNNLGAVTWGSGTTGIKGTISTANSLIGSKSGDAVGGHGVVVLSNGNYVVDSPDYSDSGGTGVGAATWGNGSTGVKGTIDSANSLVGSVADDHVGLGGVATLNNGNYVVDSYDWNHNAGAATWGSGTSGVKGTINSKNSLFGTTANDAVGLNGVTALTNGNYVVDSSHWFNGSIEEAGAVTWGKGMTGTTGAVSTTNSLVGTVAFDQVGVSGVTALTNGNYVVDSDIWGSNAVGAVTWGNGTTGLVGIVSSANSLVGSSLRDKVGSGDGSGDGGVTALSNGNYVVDSSIWGVNSVGAVTFGNGTTGVKGIVGASNSLVGTNVNDKVGDDGVTALTNGNYVVDSELWGVNVVGAVTFGNGKTGVKGTINSVNSLIGSSLQDEVGGAGVVALSNGSYLVKSDDWNYKSNLESGAVTWGNGTTGIAGIVSPANSLVGTTANDNVGDGDVTALSNGNYVVTSPDWYAELGAATFGKGTASLTGYVSGRNSEVGESPNSTSNDTVTITLDNAHSAFYAAFPGSGSGQVYRGTITGGFSNLSTGPAIAVSNNLGAMIDGTGSVNFGTATLGKPVTQVITVTNNGNRPLVVQPVTAPTGYSIVAGTNFSSNQIIAVGASASFTLQLNATATGTPGGVVTIGNNVTTANPFAFHVTGTVTLPKKVQTLSQFVDPHPQTGNHFGATVTTLANGNVVVTSPNDDAGGGSTSANTGAGAVYLYNGQTGTLISTLTGTHAGDQLGSGGVVALPNGNFVIESPDWNDDRGSVTWGSGTTGVTGTVSAGNSLVGSAAKDQVGNGGITVLSNGNYVVDSDAWINGSTVNAGAVTWGSGATGVKGYVSAANSLVGTTTNDQVGSGDFTGGDGVTALSNGNYVVDSSNWNDGAIANVGAVTWGNGKTGVKGSVGISNSLIGSTAKDRVGEGNAPGNSGVTALSNGNYVVDSVNWSNGSFAHAGAVTWGSGATGVKGTISPNNSLIGNAANDYVGDGGVTALTNGNYVVASYGWNNGTIQAAGAVTWGSGTIGVAGVVGLANSLIGNEAGDEVGNGQGATTAGGYSTFIGVIALTNGNYVVDSSIWKNGKIIDAGAVTWGNGTTGVTGIVSAANSLVGSAQDDLVGEGDVTALSNGNYVVDSPYWNNGAVKDAGAVTWGSGTTGVTGDVSASNSLVGTMSDDFVGWGDGSGEGGVTALIHGNYVVNSSDWNNAGIASAGAVTWGNGATGATGAVSSSNSLVGSAADDNVGSGDASGNGGVTALSDGNYVVNSSQWNVDYLGAVTWGSGTTGVTGVVSAANSLVGTTEDDDVGDGGVASLSNGNYVVDNDQWSNGSIVSAGAVTWSSGATGVKGTISAANSLIGTTSNDVLGSGGITGLSNGDYVVNSPFWTDDLGAVTFGSGTSGVVGVVNGSNSVLGQTATADPATINVTPDNAHGTLYVSFPSSGSGQVYRGSTADGFLSLSNHPSIVVSGNSGVLSSGTGSLSFRTATPGTPVTQSITITNYGSTPLVLQPVKAPSGFSVVNNFTANESIGAGASASFTLQLNATATGTLSGVVTIPTNDPTANPFTFNVTGTVASPKMVLQQGSTTLASGSSTVNLGSTLVGSPTTQVFTVSNNGNVPLIVTSVTAPAGFSVINDSTTNQSIAAGASTSFTLQLNANATGTPSGVVTVADNDPSASPFTFHVTGIVTAPKIVVQQGSMTLTNAASTVNLGSTPVGTPVTQVITVTNSGNAPLIVQPVTAPSGFSIDGANFTANQSITAGASASFTLQLDATAAGNPTGVVTIADSDTTASPLTFNVTGIVTPVVTAAPVLVVQQGGTTLANGTSSITFNSNSAGAAASHTFTVTNAGNAPLVMQPVTVTGGFSVVSNFAASQSIAAGQSANFTIQLNTNAYGTGVVTISDNDPAAGSFTFSVVANHPPTAVTFTPSSNTVYYGTLGYFVQVNPSTVVDVGALTTTDPDSSTVAQSFTDAVVAVSLNGTPASSPFTVDGHGNLNLAANATDGQYSVSIVSTDQGRLSIPHPQTFTINVTGISVIGVGSSSTVASGTPSGFTLATLPTPVLVVQDAPGNPNASFLEEVLAAASDTSQNPNTSVINVITYQLGVGGANSDFTINASGQLQTAETLSATVKTSYDIQIISTNTITGLSTTYPYTVTVVPVLENTVVVTPTTFTLAADSVDGTPVGTVLATDSIDQAPTYAITGGNTDNAFTINSVTGQITVANSAALDFVTNPTFALTVQATDNGALSSATIGINLGQITLSNSNVAETAKIGTVIGHFSTTEAGNGSSFRYSLVPGKNDDTDFTINDGGQLKLNVGLNASIKNSYTVDVISTNQNQQSITQAFTITVLGPSNITLSNSSVVETAKIGTVIGQLITTDAGTGNTFKYTLPAGVADNAAFTLDASGQLKLNVSLYAPTRNSFTINVVSTDQRGLSLEKTLTITVLGPSNIALSSKSVAETAKVGTVIGQFSTTDAGTGNTYQYTLPAKNLDNADFTIDASGQLKLNVHLNAAVKNHFTIDVVSTDQHGLSLEKTFTITVLGPSNIALSNSSVAETAAIGAVIGHFITTDAGAGNTFKYTLPAGDLDNADFTVDASGQLKVNVGLYAAIQNSYTVYVVSTDQRGLSLGKTFTITVLGPSNITLSNSSVAETAAIGTVIGQFSTTDAGAGNTFKYSLPAGDQDNADFTIDASGQLVLNVHLHPTLKNTFTIYVVSTDQRGLSLTKSFTITVTVS